MPTKMQGNPLWVDVTRLMREGIAARHGGHQCEPPQQAPAETRKPHLNRLNQIQI